MTSIRALRVSEEAGPTVTVVPDGDSLLEDLGNGRARLHTADGRIVELVIHADPAPQGDPRPLEVVVGGWRFVLRVEDEERAALRERARGGAAAGAHAGRAEVHSVIPGRVVAVDVAEGDIVAAGDRLLVVEAMKMQNEIRSPSDGTVLRVGVGVGGTVEIGSMLVVVG